MKKTSFIKNAFILTVTSLILRTIGIFFRVYMAGKIGAEGMGLYQLVFSIYTLAATFASAGICTAVILRQALRVLNSILDSHPFCQENAGALRRAAFCGFLISAAALVRVVFSIWYYRSPLPLTSYNALFVPVFAMFGLLCLVMSALFRQAAEMKAENDLTI